MVPILWNEEGLAGEDGQLALPWLEGTEAEKEMIRQRDEDGISEVSQPIYFGLIIRKVSRDSIIISFSHPPLLTHHPQHT